MRSATAVTIALVVAIATASLAVAAVKDPSALILRKSDIAASATYEADEGLDSYLEDALEAAG